jgi:hypothetical protein
MCSSTGQLQGQMAGGETPEVTSLGRTAQRAKYGDGAARSGVAVGAGRFQRGFVGMVGVFLLLTGGLKLVSILQESRVLGAADPLLSWLTVRQVLFLAAFLELGVGATLLRHRAARWTPGLILWLVLLFGAYRLGRWTVGWEGPCGCLGHLFERWPGFEAWANRVTWGALALMGLGSVWSIVLSGYVPSRAGSRKGDYKTILPLMVAVLWSTNGLAKSLPPIAVTAQDQSESSHPGSTEPIHTLRVSFVADTDTTKLGPLPYKYRHSQS